MSHSSENPRKILSEEEMKSVYHDAALINEGYWKALDAVLAMLNSMYVEPEITADQMRRRIYGLVMSMRPK